MRTQTDPYSARAARSDWMRAEPAPAEHRRLRADACVAARRDGAQGTRVPKRALLALAVLAILPYLNAVPAGFTFDDEYQIRTNPAVKGGIDLTQIVTSPLYPGSLFRPFTVLTFAVNQRLSPDSPAPFHALNVLLHALVTLLVCVLGARVLGSSRIGLLSAALFAVHPIHCEAVTSLVGRAELLAALCGLAALWAGAQARETRARTATVGAQYLSLLLFSLGLLSKESASTILPALLLLGATLRCDTVGPGLWNELRRLDWVPYVLCVALFVYWRSCVVSRAPNDLTPLDNVLAFVPWEVRVRSALAILWDYFGLLNLPFVLSADYSYNQVPAVTSWWALRFWGGTILLGLTTAVCLRRRWTGPVFALAFPFITLSLTANLLFPIGTVKAERLLYLPSVGWAFLAGWGFDRLLASKQYRLPAATVLCAIVLSFTGRTWIRNADWADNSALYDSMVRGAPNSAKAHYNLGVALQQRGDERAAAAQFQHALDIYPWAEGAALGIGMGWEREGRVDAAIEWFEKALRITPSFNQAHVSLCRVLVNSAQYGRAAIACREGLRYRPADPDLLKGLGLSLVGSGDPEKGRQVLRRSLAINSGDIQLRSYLGSWTAGEGRGE